MKDIEYSKLSKEAFEYLSKANALFGTPIERLEKMNEEVTDEVADA